MSDCGCNLADAHACARQIGVFTVCPCDCHRDRTLVERQQNRAWHVSPALSERDQGLAQAATRRKPSP
jgi:hypothetical protein